MIVRLSVLALCTALVVTPALAEDKSAPAAAVPTDTIACDGVFGPLSSEALLKETFGAENVVTGQVPGPEGTEMLATTIFPDDPTRTMQIGWWDENKLERLAYVDLAPGQVGPLGVQIGMTPEQIEALNGEGFLIGGFWWDYGGYANIESGNLTNLPGGCYLSLRFSPQDDYRPDLDLTSISGEVQVPSDDPLLQQLDTRVQVVSLSYPSPEAL
jgi:hypothetical protein